MIVYQGTNISFRRDVINGLISSKIDHLFEELGIPKENYAEYTSWRNSLPRMANILTDNRISDDAEVAIEFQIPLTSKRVDFMIAGSNGISDNVVIVELKQWEKCTATSRENVVIAFTGGEDREVAHPSQQAYAYAKLIENFNEDVAINDIKLIPCAYLHNYENQYRNEILHPKYNEAIESAPVFLMEDGEALQNFIAKYVTKSSNKKLYDIIDHGKLKPSKALQDAVGSILNGNKEFEMIDEQLVAYSTILKLAENTINKDEKHTVIVKGGPGTGKSVIAVNLLAKIINNGYTANYVSKNGAPRRAFSESLVRGKYDKSYLKGLFKGSGNFVNTPRNTFDCLLCDEAHRLNEKSGMFHNLGENQVKEIINAAKISVFFIDEDQVIASTDIGSIAEIKKWARKLGSKVHDGKSLELKSQFRCNGSDGYLAFLDSVLQIRETANYNYFDLDYDIEIFDDPNEMKEALRKKNNENKARMIAGYCYPWDSQKDKTKYDIYLENGFKAQWNFTTDTFAFDEDSFEQVGCIHSTQGLEFDYVGIIIGKDLRYENGKVVADRTKRAKSDATVKWPRYVDEETRDKLGDKIIRNTYKTLLSRGKYGCYVYCEDKALSNYLREKLNKAKEMKKKLENK